MKKFLYTTLFVIVGIVAIMLLLNIFAKQKIENMLEEQDISYEEINLNLYTNFLKIKNPDAEVKGFKLTAENINIEDFNYWNYLTSGKYEIEDVTLNNPTFFIQNEQKEQKDSTKTSNNFREQINIENFKIFSGKIIKSDTANAESSTDFRFQEFGMKNITVDSASVENKIPFNFTEYFLLDGQLKTKLNEQHDFLISEINMRDGKILLKDLQIQPLYGEKEFYEKVQRAESRYTLSVDEVRLSNLQFKTQNDSLLLTNPVLEVENFDLSALKDKTLPEYDERKTLYSEKLRELPFKIDFDTVKCTKGTVTYHEKTQIGKPAGAVNFSKVKVDISNLTNLKSAGETQVAVNAMFMGVAGSQFNYTFNTWSTNNQFTSNGRINTFKAAIANKFLNPTENIELEGEIDYLAFNLNGNENIATGEVQLKYHDFSVEIMKKEGGEKKFLSAVANIFVNNKAINEEVKQQVQMERDKQKSFWNFIWKFVFEGIKKTIL